MSKPQSPLKRRCRRSASFTSTQSPELYLIANHAHRQAPSLYRECQQRDIPYVYITTRRKLAQVDWDYFALDPKHDHWLGKGNPDLDGKMFREIRHLAETRPGNPLRFGSAMVGGVKDVPIEWAAEVAEIAFKMQYDAIREGERQAVA